jgi:hypothetical protein
MIIVIMIQILSLLSSPPTTLESDLCQEQVRTRARSAVLSASSSDEAGRAYIRLMEGAGPSDLNELMDDASTAIALHARWKLCKEVDAEDRGYYAHRFLGFIEGRFGMKAPLRFEVSIVSAHECTGEEIARKLISSYIGKCDFLKMVDKKPCYYPIEYEKCKEFRDVRLPKGATIDRKDAGLELRMDGSSIILAVESVKEIEQEQQVRKRCMFKRGKYQSYVAIHDQYGSRYLLVSMDPKSGKVLWKTKVWGLGSESVSVKFGSFHHDVEIVETAKNVAVFGNGSGGCYVEVFDRKSGAPKCRFSTNYWSQSKDCE